MTFGLRVEISAHNQWRTIEAKIGCSHHRVMRLAKLHVFISRIPIQMHHQYRNFLLRFHILESCENAHVPPKERRLKSLQVTNSTSLSMFRNLLRRIHRCDVIQMYDFVFFAAPSVLPVVQTARIDTPVLPRCGGWGFNPLVAQRTQPITDFQRRVHFLQRKYVWRKSLVHELEQPSHGIASLWLVKHNLLRLHGQLGMRPPGAVRLRQDVPGDD
mmetsp:Transcript_28414/g.79968  ORF Transcript_28414/g.79968 Transcript_28414/m.79968 type:complete len:215 (+) Transcript_28414:1664-2308(+)